MRPGNHIAALEDIASQLHVRRADFEGDAAAEPRAHPFVQRFEFRRRPVGGHHHLAGAVDQLVEHVAELLLHRLALQELHVVDEEEVDLAERFLEGDRRMAAERRHEAEHEMLRRQIDDVARRLPDARRPRDGVKKMRLAASDTRVDVERIVGRRTAGHRFGDRFCRRERHPVGRALAERVKGVARIDR